MDELEGIINGEEQPVEAAEPQQEPQATEQPQEPEKATDGQPRGPDGKFAPKGEQDDAPPASEDKAKGLEAGIAAERKKRQELESQIEALRREMAEARKPKEPPAPPPSYWEDEDTARQYDREQTVRQSLEGASYLTKLQTSEFYARKNIEGFDQDWEPLNKWLTDNPTIAQRAAQDFDPWGYAHRAYRNDQTMQQLGATNLDELKAQLLEQLKAEQAAQAPAAPNLPRSLADAQSAKGANAPAPAPLSLEEILGR